MLQPPTAKSNAHSRDPYLRSLAGRALVLMALLLGIKVWLITGLREDLIQSHWRFIQDANASLTSTCFYILLLQIAISLGLLAGRCDGMTLGSVRRLNAGFALVGAVFVMVSLSKSGTSFLFQAFDGGLGGSDLRRFLVAAGFIAHPFLGLYFLAYVLCYGLLVVARREAWSPYLLALIAVTYASINLRELQALAGELVVVNLFGVVALWSAWRSRGRPLGGGWHFFWLGLIVVGWLVFWQPLTADETPSRFLVTCLALFGAGYLVVLLAARRSSVFPVLSHLLPFYSVGFLLLANRAYPVAENYNHIVVWSLAAPRYVALDGLLVLGLLGVAWLFGQGTSRRAQCGRWVFDGGAVILLLLALADVLVTRHMGIRLDWNVIALSDDLVLALRTIGRYAWHFIGWGGLLAGLYRAAIGWWGRGGARWFAAPNVGSQSSLRNVAAVCCLLALASPLLVEVDKGVASPTVNLLATSPLARLLDPGRLTPEEFIRESKELGIVDYRKPLTNSTIRQPELMNVVLVILESTFNRHLSLFGGKDETQPLLRKYRDRMELFPNYYAPFPNSLHARFSILNGMYPGIDYVSYVNPRIPAPSLFEILKQRGYVNSLFYSSHRDYTRFADYVGHRQLDFFYDCRDMPGREKFKPVSWGVEESCTKAAIESQFVRHAKAKERFFLTYIPAAPHQPFDVQDRRFTAFDASKASSANDFTGAYKNSLLYVDWVVAGLVDKLAELGLLDTTLVVISGDHGELLGEAGGQLGHGWKVEPGLSNVPLIIMNPRRPGYRVNLAPGSHVDLLPTVLDLLRLDLPKGEFYQGVSLFDASAARDRRIYITSYLERAMIAGDKFISEDPEWRQQRVRTFEISHDGERSEYRQVAGASRVGADLDRFQRLQSCLIRYYSFYRDALQGPGLEDGMFSGSSAANGLGDKRPPLSPGQN